MSVQQLSLRAKERVDTRDPVAQRILTVLEACAANRRPVTITQIVERTGLAKSTVHRMCWKLAEIGLLEHADDGFLIGTKLVTLASANPAVSEIRTAAMPYLLELQGIAGASNLAVLSGRKALIVDGLYDRKFHMTPRTGYALPLHLTAVGKAMMAAMSPVEREALLAGPLAAATSRSIVHPDILRRHLATIAERGFAVAQEEFQPGMVCVAAAFPAREGLLAAIGCVGVATNRGVLNATGQVVDAAAKLRRHFAVGITRPVF